MKYLFGLIVIVITLQIISVHSYAQQYEDVVYLKNGSVVHGTILEQVIGESVKIKTKDGNLFVFKQDEIEKLTKEEIILKKEEVKKVENDSVKTKNMKTGLKTDANENKKKELNAKNSITIQPIGLFTLLSNIEYDRALSGTFSAGIKISYMTFLLRGAISFKSDNPSDADNAEAMKKSLSGWGIGGHIRIYPGSHAVEHFFLGIAVEKLSISYDKVEGDLVKTTTPNTANLVRLEFEIGDRIKLSNKEGGFTILWSLGAGVGFGSAEEKDFTIPLGSIGFGLGYSF